MELVVVLEECGAALLPVPFLATVGQAAGALRGLGQSAAEVLNILAQGAVGALVAAPFGSRLPGPVLTWSGGRLVGTANAVPEAVRADLFIALAADTEGVPHVAAFRAAGVHVQPEETIDPSRPTASLRVDVIPELCLPVDPKAVLTPPLIASAAELVGVADRALAVSVEHARSRRQFGQPIGAFQGVKHRLADAYVTLERARSLTYLAAARCAAGGQAGALTWQTAMLAKAAANDAASECTRSGVAIHGAIGQTWEHDLHLFLRRAWHGSALLGESSALYAAAAGVYVADEAQA